MTFVGLGWAATGASDLHLLPGLVGPDLRLLLRAFDSTATGQVLVKELDDLPGLTVAFTEHLVGTGASHGVGVDRASGEVDVRTAALKGRSFIITASATQAGTTHTTRIRVTVHRALTRMWLTPGPRLTVRDGASGMRFSVLALFDDGIIGDIGNWSPFEKPGAAHTYVHARGVNSPALTWSSAGPPVAVDAETGVLTASADTGRSVITARFGAAAPATATAVCARPWSTATPLTHLGGPGVRSVNFVPNVLFLPDGFTEADRDAFQDLVRLVVRRLEHRNRAMPFAALLGRLNYWLGWLASPQAGISVLDEVGATGRVGAVDQVEQVPRPSENPPAANWRIADLVAAVGLPNPVADPTGSPIGPKIAEWRSLYPSATEPVVSRKPSLYAEWLTLNNRVLVDERDTALHMAFGSRPAIGDGVDRGIAPNPRRLGTGDFTTFLNALRGPGNEFLGPLWTSGKDRNLVVVVCRSSHHGGTRSRQGGTIAVSLADRAFHRVQASTTGGGFELKPDDLSADASYSLWLTTARELGLDDESGGDVAAPNVHHRDSLRMLGKTVVDRIELADR